MALFESTAENGIETAGEGLADQRGVGLNAFVFLGEHFARAPQAGLDFIENQGHVVPIADFADLAGVAGRRHHDAGLALDWFDQEGHGIWGDRLLSATASPNGTTLNPGANGPNPSR